MFQNYSCNYILEHGKFLGYLEPRFDRCKSFYKKARVYQIDNQLFLISYNTNVMNILIEDGKSIKAQFFGYYSATTSRHLHEFYKQCELPSSDFPTAKQLKNIEKDLQVSYVTSIASLDRILNNMWLK